MKKIYIFIITTVWLFSLSQVNAQEVKFKLYGFNPCTRNIEAFSLFSLKKEENYYPKDSSGICVLPDTGRYILNFFDEQKEYFFNEFKTYIDTLKIPSIQFCHELSTRVAFSGYCCCDSLCQGDQVDFYSNGNKRIEGHFNKGKPIGILNFYYSTGQLQLVEKYDNTGNLLKRIQYDKTGNLIKKK